MQTKQRARWAASPPILVYRHSTLGRPWPGKYNAGAQHKGYNAVTSWGDAALLSEKRPAMSQTARDKIDNFTAPFNERLFARTSHRCRWGRDRPAP